MSSSVYTQFSRHSQLANDGRPVWMSPSHSMLKTQLDTRLIYLTSFLIGVLLLHTCNCSFVGPSFVKEPPARVDFANDTGARVECVAAGSPRPTVSWLQADGKPVAGVAQLLDIEPDAAGVMHFVPFVASSYRHDVHAATYRCQATNAVGTIVSRDVRLRAVVLQFFEMHVLFSKTVLRGNTAVLRCTIPSFVREFITVTSWLQDSSFNIYPSMKGDGKYHMLLSGELLIRKVDDADRYRSYQCRAVNRLTGTTLISTTRARFSVLESRAAVAPRPSDKTSTTTQTIQVRKDQSTTIACYTEAYPPPTYRWYRQERQSLRDVVENDRIFRVGECLVILHADEADAGRWVCVANNTEGSQRFDFNLQVHSALTVSLLPSGQLTADVGSRVEVQCLVQGATVTSRHITRTWLKDGHPIDGQHSADSSASAVLALPKIQREDAGMYQCLVRVDDDSAQSSLQVILGAAHPQLLYKFIHQTLQPGPPVSLKCIAAGNPTPHITWKLDGFPLPQNERFVIGQYVSLHGDVISHVNISNVQVQDGGIYQCTAGNRIGQVSHSAQMRVYGVPFIRAMPNISAVAGEPLYLACPVAGYPIDSINWEKDGKKLPVNRRQRVFSNGTLLLVNVQRDSDKGNYRCIAANKQGRSASQTLVLNVIVPPKIAPFSFETDLHLGDRAGIQCFVAKGDTPLNIRWSKDGATSLGLGVVVRQLDKFTSSLSIQSLSPEHAGQYSCTASNHAANVSHSSTLLVNVPPRWVSEPQDINVTRGSMAVFHCQAEGFPTPTLTWRKVIGRQPSEYEDINSRTRGVQITSNGTLIIRQALPEHQGQYLCEATNGIGAGLSATVNLIVHIAPEFEVKSAQASVRRGSSQTLVCQAIGDLPMGINWHADGSGSGSQPSIQFNPRYVIKESQVKDGLISELQISNTVKSDSGTFTCTASNPFGHAERTVHLQVQDAPGKAHDVRVVNSGSRSVKLTWLAPLDDQNPVLQYIIQYKQEAADEWQSVRAESGVSGGMVGVVGDLQPAMVYTMRVVAENELGAGEPSEPVLLRTEAEAPAGQPLNVVATALTSDQLKVTWTAPLKHLCNGDILGYYVGYRLHNANRATGFNFTTVPPSSNDANVAILSNLKKYRSYAIVVQAYNEKGPGPMSNEIIAQTLEDVPSAPPTDIQCTAQSSQILRISWQPPPTIFQNGQLLGYRVYYENMQEFAEGVIEADMKVTPQASTDLHGLQKYSNYTIQVWAYNKIGDGVKSKPIFCMTEEDVPEAPSGIKVIVSSPSSLIVSWGVPTRANGQLTSYNVYSRVLESGRERDSFKRHLPPTQTHYQANDLRRGETYEFWVTAFTRVGEGHSTQVEYGSISNRVPASIISFGQRMMKRGKSSVRMECLSVGIPPPKRSWFVPDGSQPSGEIFSQHNDGSLEISEVQRHHQGNYTCSVTNVNGSDQITYSLQVLVAPSAPVIRISATGTSWLELEWKIGDNGGSAVRGFILNLKRFEESGDQGESEAEWNEKILPRDLNTYKLTGLDCGLEYNLQLMAYNLVGSGSPSSILTAKTDGDKPAAPSFKDFIITNVTTITLHLKSWNANSCTITMFNIEHKEIMQEEWLTGVEVQSDENFLINGLWPGTQYVIKVKATNSAGSTTAEYTATTLPILGATISPDSVKISDDEEQFDDSMYLNAQLLIPTLISVAALCTLVLAVTICIKRKGERDIMVKGVSDSQAMVSLDNKQNLAQREQYYAAVHKGLATPIRDLQCIERIPEYADDISPYATFHVAGERERATRALSSPRHIQSFVYHDNRLAAMETMQLKNWRLTILLNPKKHDYTRLRGSHKSTKCMNTGSDYSGSTTDQWSEHGLTRMPVQSTLYGSSMGGHESSTSPEASPVPDRRSSSKLRAHVRLEETSSFLLPAHLDPPSGFSDTHELSEAECDMKSLHLYNEIKNRHRESQHRHHSSGRSKRSHHFTIAV
ncbi:hypothetical protein LSTR_LSTR005632 [Laodelphax striatellus]|uniref:Down syndrome cell adhesion molecule-like protein Dscam2 n=1 Tax=Laodelphax striatellus TaxID=195883 RepID=A0A482WW62_LAOST|nr:hypothetical protein LSTR_LSTR005632 [Laodelphax striatellus]